jgi:hypothetical protein
MIIYNNVKEKYPYLPWEDEVNLTLVWLKHGLLQKWLIFGVNGSTRWEKFYGDCFKPQYSLKNQI